MYLITGFTKVENGFYYVYRIKKRYKNVIKTLKEIPKVIPISWYKIVDYGRSDSEDGVYDYRQKFIKTAD